MKVLAVGQVRVVPAAAPGAWVPVPAGLGVVVRCGVVPVEPPPPLEEVGRAVVPPVVGRAEVPPVVGVPEVVLG